MTVNKLTRGRLCALMLLLLWLCPAPTTQALIRCKTSILNRYKLSGLEYAVNQPMKVCPSVIDRCCSVTDEVTISRLWNDKTLPQLNTATERIMKNMWLTIQYHKNITLMDPGLIMVKHLIKRRIPFARRTCWEERRPLTRRELRRAQRYFQVGDLPFEEPDLGSLDLVNTFTSRHPNDTRWNFNSAGFVNKTIANPRFDHGFADINEEFNFDAFALRRPRELEEIDSFMNKDGDHLFPSDYGQDRDLSQFLTQNDAFGQQRDLQDIDRPLTRIEREHRQADAGVLPNKEVSSGVADHFDMYRYVPEPTPVQPVQVVPPMQQQINPPPLVPVAPPRPEDVETVIRPNPVPPTAAPASYFDPYLPTSQLSQRNRAPVSSFNLPPPGIPNPLESSAPVFDRLNPDHRREAARRKQSFGRWSDDEMLRFDRLNDHYNLTNTRTRVRRSQFRLSNYRIEGRSLTIPRVRCRSPRRSFIKDFIIINEEKVDFCFGLYRRFLNFDIELFEGFLPKVKESIAKLSEHKKSFYCMLCDAHKAQYISLGAQQIVYSTDYCRTTLSTFSDYFRFMNLIYVDFVDSLLQYINCFESDGLVFEFPFQNYLTRMKQRYPFWRKCLDSLDSEFFINSCWSICTKLNLNLRSNVIEGDPEFFERTTATIFSFLRKFKIESERAAMNETRRFNDTFSASFTINLRTGRNVNGLLVEPLGPAHLITDNKYVFERNSSDILVKHVPGTNMTDRDIMQAAIDDMLTDLQMGTVEDLINYGRQVLGYRRMEQPLDPRFVANADRPVSRVNGLVNQLYKLRTIQQLSPNEIPARFLKQETYKIMHKYGLRPKEYVRTLKLFTPPGARKLTLRLPPWRDDQVIPKTIRVIQAYGTAINHTGPVPPPPIEKVDPHINAGDIENRFEIYQKMINGTDVKNLAVVYEKEGINPLQDFEMANYNFNITRLIGMQFIKAEKIDSEVIKMFIKCNAADINQFNENKHKHTISMAEMEAKYQGLKQASQYETLAKILAPDKNVSLAMQVQRRFRNKMSEMMKVHSKNQALEAMEARMQQMYKLDAIMKEKEREKQSVNHHWFPLFDELFNGIGDLFISLFGE